MRARISSAVLVHTKGYGGLLPSSTYRRMAASSWGVLRRVPRRIDFSVSTPNQRPTRLIHDASLGREVQVEPGVAEEPAVTRGGLVRPIVFEDKVDVQGRRDRRLEGVQELAERDRPVPAVALPNDRAGLNIRGGEQGRGQVAMVVVRPPLRLAGPHRSQRLRPIQGLDLPLLVRAQHQGLVRRLAECFSLSRTPIVIKPYFPKEV